MDENTTLADLGVGPNGTIQLEMQSADPVNTPIKTYRPRQEYHMPDVITVRVQTGKNYGTDLGMSGVNAMKFHPLRCNSIYQVKLHKVIKIHDYTPSFISLLGISNIELHDF